MAGNKTHIQVLDGLKPWVGALNYNPETGRWTGQLKPRGIVDALSFQSFIGMLEQHVVKEIIELVAEALNFDAKEVLHYTRKREIVDLRIVAAIVLQDNFKVIRQRSISPLLGWRNRSMLPHAKKQANVNEIDKKLQRVYKLHPELKNGNIEILNRN